MTDAMKEMPEVELVEELEEERRPSAPATLSDNPKWGMVTWRLITQAAYSFTEQGHRTPRGRPVDATWALTRPDGRWCGHRPTIIA